MAISLLDTPIDKIIPVYNEAYWVALSSEIGQTNFKYRVVITDLLTSATITKDYFKRPVDSKLVAETNFFAELYTKNFIPNNVYGFQVCTDAVRRIQVNIGEVYDVASVSTYFPGSNDTYYVWNGVVSNLEYPNYNAINYTYYGANRIALTNRDIDIAYEDKSNFVYFLGHPLLAGGAIPSIDIDTYDVNGTFIATSTISNPLSATTNYYEKYVCIDVGHKGLSNVSSGVVTGAYPIITPSVARWNVKQTAVVNYYKIFTMQCEAKCDVKTLHFLNSKGNFETIHFSKASTLRSDVIRKEYKQNQFDLNASNEFTYTNQIGQQKNYNTTEQQSLTLQTDWLDYEEIEAKKDIITNCEVYIEDSTYGLVPVMVDTSSFVILKKWNTGEPYIQLAIKYGHINMKQRG